MCLLVLQVASSSTNLINPVCEVLHTNLMLEHATVGVHWAFYDEANVAAYAEYAEYAEYVLQQV